MLDIATSSSGAASKFMHARSALPFFAWVFGSTWLFQLPYLLAKHEAALGPAERFMPLVVLGFFGPFLIAIALSLREGGSEGLRALFRPLRIRTGVAWYLAALALPCTLFLVARAAGGPLSSSDLGPWLYPPTQPQHFAAMLVIPFTEQIPWLGFAFPRLRARHGSRAAIALTGLAWALFHLQKHAFLDPSYVNHAAIMIPYMTAGAIVFGWLLLRAGGSLLVAVLANAGAYLNNPVQALPSSSTPLALHAVALSAAALAVMFGDRAIWRTRSHTGQFGVE
jgi:membrane protease YdiL (CAAX protease family)